MLRCWPCVTKKKKKKNSFFFFCVTTVGMVGPPAAGGGVRLVADHVRRRAPGSRAGGRAPGA
eukprot:7143670-Prymnesium_polylepis.1